MKLVYLTFMLFIFYTKPKDTRQQMLQQNQGRLKLGNFRHLHRHRLNVPPQESSELDMEIQCVSSCLKKPNCFSLNTKKTTDDKFLCEFLNTSKYRYHDNLTKDDNYVHWYIEDPCLPHPCNNGKCVATDTPTRFTCDCYVWALGKRCDINNYDNVGCYKDIVNSRAITTLEGTDSILDGHYKPRKNAIVKCALAAIRAGYSMFAVQDGGWCAASATAHSTFDKYGKSTRCKADGEGGPSTNQVYTIKEMP